MKSRATWSPAPFLNVTGVERQKSRWLVTVFSRERVFCPVDADAEVGIEPQRHNHRLCGRDTRREHGAGRALLAPDTISPQATYRPI
jgi:hypothetical protein